MPQFDSKLWIIAALFAVLIVVKLLARKPYDTPVRRRRRFGHGGTETESKLRVVEGAGEKKPEEPPKDPEKEFFKE